LAGTALADWQSIDRIFEVLEGSATNEAAVRALRAGKDRGPARDLPPRTPREQRDAMILEAFSSGRTVIELSVAYRLGTKRIYQILGGIERRDALPIERAVHRVGVSSTKKRGAR